MCRYGAQSAHRPPAQDDRSRLRPKIVAWHDSARIAPRRLRRGGGLAAHAGPAQYLGAGGPRRLLEVLGDPPPPRRRARLVPARREQLVPPAPRSEESGRTRLEAGPGG